MLWNTMSLEGKIVLCSNEKLPPVTDVRKQSLRGKETPKHSFTLRKMFGASEAQ